MSNFREWLVSVNLYCQVPKSSSIPGPPQLVDPYPLVTKIFAVRKYFVVLPPPWLPVSFVMDGTSI